MLLYYDFNINVIKKMQRVALLRRTLRDLDGVNLCEIRDSTIADCRITGDRHISNHRNTIIARYIPAALPISIVTRDIQSAVSRRITPHDPLFFYYCSQRLERSSDSPTCPLGAYLQKLGNSIERRNEYRVRMQLRKRREASFNLLFSTRK